MTVVTATSLLASTPTTDMARRQRRKKLPPDPVEVTIESLSHNGRGVAHVDERAVFIDGALPGEQVTFIYTDRKRDYAEGRVETVITASDQRVEPPCPHYGICGGCSFQHLAPEQQIIAKQSTLEQQLKQIGKVSNYQLWPPLTGPLTGYRQKARLGVKNVAKKGRVLVGFREKRTPFIAEIEQCLVLHPQIGERLMALSSLIGSLTIKNRLPQIEVAIGDHRSALIFRVLLDPTEQDRAQLIAFGDAHHFDIYLQRHGPDSVVCLNPHAPMLSYELPNHALELDFKPDQFTQVNSAINRAMIDRVIETLRPEPSDTILDLFCGLGNFTLPLARQAGHVVGVEGSQQLVDTARHNAIKNGIENVTFHSADLTLDLSENAWANQQYDKILIDPSRAGAQELLSQLPKWVAQRVLYVSCNPSTLARDAGILVNQLGYQLIRAGVMDMFPHTSHVESMALFERVS